MSGASGATQVADECVTVPHRTGKPAAHRVFRVRDDVAVEGFDDGGLVLRLSDRQFVEFDPIALYIVEQTDGMRAGGRITSLQCSLLDCADGDTVAEVVVRDGSLFGSHWLRGTQSVGTASEDMNVVRCVVAAASFLKDCEVSAPAAGYGCTWGRGGVDGL